MRPSLFFCLVFVLSLVALRYTDIGVDLERWSHRASQGQHQDKYA